MNRKFVILGIALFLGFVSCTEDTAPPISCFTMSANPANSGQTVYFLNCSENYNNHIWTIDGIPFSDRHLSLAFPGPDTLDVVLKVWGPKMIDSNISSQQLFIN